MLDFVVFVEREETVHERVRGFWKVLAAHLKHLHLEEDSVATSVKNALPSQHVVILVRNKGLSQLDKDNMW